MDFASLIAGLDLPSVEAFSGVFPAGTFMGTIKQAEVSPAGVNNEGKQVSARLTFIYELTMPDGKTRDLYDTLWIPSGSPQTWSQNVTEAGKKSEYEQNVMAARRLRTRLDQIGLQANGSQDPAMAVGMPVRIKVKHNGDYANITEVTIPKQAPASPAGIPQQQAQPVPVNHPAQQGFTPQATTPAPNFGLPQAGAPVATTPAPNPFAGV